ncbi:MAG: hypothetical protein LUQ57_00620 [Methylococcaceae bacterium]|nr:hypothetical protein [Methylococcaceae bacterium]
MNQIIKRLMLAGLMALPAACATYPQPYYDSGTSYYYPGSYNSGYGVIERNYYSTYSYPMPVYRTETHHHHYDNTKRYPDRRNQDTRPYSTYSGTTNRRRDIREHGANDYYNWNVQTAKRYDNRNEGWQPRPDRPTAHGQWQRQQNWEQQEARRENNGVADRFLRNQQSEWNRPRHDDRNRNEGRQHRPNEAIALGQWQRQQNLAWKESRRQNNGFADRPSFQAGSRSQSSAPAQSDERHAER